MIEKLIYAFYNLWSDQIHWAQILLYKNNRTRLIDKLFNWENPLDFHAHLTILVTNAHSLASSFRCYQRLQCYRQDLSMIGSQRVRTMNGICEETGETLWNVGMQRKGAHLFLIPFLPHIPHCFITLLNLVCLLLLWPYLLGSLLYYYQLIPFNFPKAKCKYFSTSTFDFIHFSPSSLLLVLPQNLMLQLSPLLI